MTEHPTNYSRTLRVLEDAAELIDRITQAIPGRWPHIVDALPGQPKAQDLDGDRTGPSSIVVCDRHRQDVSACIRAGHVGCSGASIPQRSDPTGNAATQGDRATHDLADFRKTANRIGRDAERLVTILASYGPREATDHERQLTRENDPGCVSCARLPGIGTEPKWVPVEQGTKVGDEIVKVCSWCRTWIRNHGNVMLPPKDVLAAHHRDGDRRLKRGA